MSQKHIHTINPTGKKMGGDTNELTDTHTETEIDTVEREREREREKSHSCSILIIIVTVCIFVRVVDDLFSVDRSDTHWDNE